MTTLNRQSALFAVHQELSAYMRFRSDPEYLYAAASIAGSGAVAWGIAAIPGTYLWAHLVAAVGVIAAGATVWACITPGDNSKAAAAATTMMFLMFPLPVPASDGAVDAACEREGSRTGAATSHIPVFGMLSA